MIDLSPILVPYAKRRVRKLEALHPEAAQELWLKRLIAAGSMTRFGKEHGFDGLRGVADYQAAVPLRDYDDFWNQYWRRDFPNIKGSTWPQQPPFFALSSGTCTGVTKYIPLTKQGLVYNSRAGTDLLCWHLGARPDSKILKGRSLIMGGSTDLRSLAPGIRAGDLSGIVAANLPSYLRPWYAPPKDIALLSDWDRKLDALVELARKADIRSISGVPAWLQVFSGRLADRAQVNQSWAELFPRLELVVHGGVNFAPYAPWFQKVLEGSRAELREVYPASEGFIALSDRGPADGLRLLVDHGIFYEFVPLDELHAENPTRHWVGDIRTGINYAVVLTTCSGLWSYILGDTVRFIETMPPRLVVSGRIAWTLSAFGEHLIAQEVDDAVCRARDKLGLELSEYCVGADIPMDASRPGRHIYLVEFGRRPGPVELERFSLALDRRLKQLNEDYLAHREGGVGLGAPKVLPLSIGGFKNWMQSQGKLGGQHKVPRIMADHQQFVELLNYFKMAEPD